MAGSRASSAGGGPTDEPQPGGFDLVDRFAADLRVDEAAAARARRATLGAQADEEATVRGVLVDLGERAAHVRLELDGGRSLAGVVTHVGVDQLHLRTLDGHGVLVALDAVGAVRAALGGR